MQPDLFAPAAPPGLRSTQDFISAADERQLTARIDAAPLAPFRFQGWTGKRLTASYGWHYDFDAARFAEVAPLPDWLIPLRDRAAAFAGLEPSAFVHALLTRYDPGAGIGWHRDRPVFEHVVGVSLGASAVMRLRRHREQGFERARLPLPPRSIYHLTGPARWEWEHSITPLDQRRWSVTFRSLRQ